ncbi:BAHD acyltransferase DCR-like [Tasmannia lanceolata]|uniref:BAHD acyltransferase DCR-like n=1 Tax=Tasmannia lanceolata TaxID=3420 RepID=UPI00406405FF
MATENGKDEEVGVVKIISKTKVLPHKTVEKSECPLVTFDLPYVTFYYNQKVLLYRGGDFEEIVGKLKEGLGVVLEYFYPLSGRMGKDEEGVLKVEKCGEEDAGVEVVEAIAEGVFIDELTQDEAPPLLQKIVPFTGVMNLDGLYSPLLVVQFTKLRDGIAIGCAFNHAILDGNSTWHFMSSWAEICRGSEAPSLIPFHDRTQARNIRLKLDLPESTASHDDSAVATLQSLREKIFHFSENSMDKIKAKANASLTNGSRPLSTFQSLGTHLWHAITRARTHLKPEDYTVFTIFANCRKRVNPPMPESYFGNLIQAIFTVTATGLLLAHPPEFGAGLLQQAIGAHDAKVIEARSKEWESAPKLFNYKDAGINTVTVGSSPKFPVYDVDFGWGRPEMVRSGSNNKFDGMVYLYPGRNGGRSVDVEITLEPKTMENLENDKEFLMVSD